MTQDHPNDSHVNALFQEKRRGRVPRVMHAGVLLDFGQLEKFLPLLQVNARLDRASRTGKPLLIVRHVWVTPESFG
ncbi:hypothetical protein Pth03_10180 [Planotetraspora thailandica]|uniref:Uncharacterized protein n=1 Tax=Planotetraspora thailandica TaxID=487172 RepID=A0A8J3UV93_9ACTN|nr:hypothetical protein Pth03_10180 [Planotetraspora thailandica]